MATYGLSATGFTAARQADYLSIIRAELNSRLTALGFTDLPDYEHDTFLGEVTEVMAYLLGQLGEGQQAVYDARSVANATGIQLDNLALIVGVTRNEATRGTATGTLAGTVGTVILTGKEIQWGGTDGRARWRLTGDVTIGAGGTASGNFQAVELGEIIATTGDTVTIATPVSGWTGVTFATSATPGQERETDSELRVRRQRSLQAAGSSSTAAILAAVLALDFVTGAVVVDNKTGGSVTTDGVTLDAYSVAVVAAPSSMTNAQKAELVEAIYGRLAAGTLTSGVSFGTATKADGRSETVRFTLAADSAVNVAFTLVLEPGYVVGDVEDALEALVTDYFLTLSCGATVYPSPLIALAMSVEGITNVTSLLLDGGASPVTHLATELPVLGTFAAT